MPNSDKKLGRVPFYGTNLGFSIKCAANACSENRTKGSGYKPEPTRVRFFCGFWAEMDLGRYGASGNIKITFIGKNGKNIATFSTFPEQEVLFNMNSIFEVKTATLDNGLYKVALLEK